MNKKVAEVSSCTTVHEGAPPPHSPAAAARRRARRAWRGPAQSPAPSPWRPAGSAGNRAGCSSGTQREKHTAVRGVKNEYKIIEKEKTLFLGEECR